MLWLMIIAFRWEHFIVYRNAKPPMKRTHPMNFGTECFIRDQNLVCVCFRFIEEYAPLSTQFVWFYQVSITMIRSHFFKMAKKQTHTHSAHGQEQRPPLIQFEFSKSHLEMGLTASNLLLKTLLKLLPPNAQASSWIGTFSIFTQRIVSMIVC